jgi:hypothetical protein
MRLAWVLPTAVPLRWRKSEDQEIQTQIDLSGWLLAPGEPEQSGISAMSCPTLQARVHIVVPSALQMGGREAQHISRLGRGET